MGSQVGEGLFGAGDVRAVSGLSNPGSGLEPPQAAFCPTLLTDRLLGVHKTERRMQLGVEGGLGMTLQGWLAGSPFIFPSPRVDRECHLLWLWAPRGDHAKLLPWWNSCSGGGDAWETRNEESVGDSVGDTRDRDLEKFSICCIK